MRDRFDNLLIAAQSSPPAWRDALVAVADTAFICRAWLEEYAPGFTPADLLVMTKMVVEREAIEIARSVS